MNHLIPLSASAVLSSNEGVVALTRNDVSTTLNHGALCSSVLVIPCFTLVWSEISYDANGLLSVVHGASKRIMVRFKEGVMLHRVLVKIEELIMIWVDGEWLIKEKEFLNEFLH